MQEVALLHEPRWQLSSEGWHMIVGNRSVARIVADFSASHPQYKWLSIIDGHDYPDHGWHAVDFETLEMAKYDLEQWWYYMCRGVAYRPEIHEQPDD